MSTALHFEDNKCQCKSGRSNNTKLGADVMLVDDNFVINKGDVKEGAEVSVNFL